MIYAAECEQRAVLHFICSVKGFNAQRCKSNVEAPQILLNLISHSYDMCVCSRESEQDTTVTVSWLWLNKIKDI